MTFEPHRKYLNSGEWVACENSVQSTPARGAAQPYCVGMPDLLDQTVHDVLPDDLR